MAARVFALILTALFALTAFCGCTSGETTGRSVCEKYLECIQNGDYSGAYALLSDTVKNSTQTPKSGKLTEKEFIERYTNIFDALDITAITYRNIRITDGEIMTSADYDAVYHSEPYGEMDGAYKLVAVRRSGVWGIEWTPALIFPDMEWGDTVRMGAISAKRGDIMASNEVLAQTVGATSVFAIPSKIENKELFIEQMCSLLSMTAENVEKALKREVDDFTIIKQYYPDQISEAVIEQVLAVTGAGVDYGNYGSLRVYPYGSLLAHIIGYVGPVSAESEEALEKELAALNEGRAKEDGLYNSDSNVGKLGLEKQYEKELRGKDGLLIYIRTAQGTRRRTLYRREPEDGQDIVLTIDLDTQLRTEELLRYVLYGEKTAGAVVVLDPLTGKIDAMASFPSYDLNLFSRRISSEDYQALLNNPAKPLYNRLTQGRYPPGSVWKAFTAAAALDTAAADETFPINDEFIFEQDIDEDYWTPTEYGTWIWPPIKRATVKYRQGPFDMNHAIINSDNIFFAYTALTLGKERLFGFMESLGFSESIPFDLPVSSAQLINEDTEVTFKMLADSGYGQGEILITPLQLASAFGAIANGGTIMQPRIVDEFCRVDGIKYNVVYRSSSSVYKQNAISKATLDKLIPMLENVTKSKLNGTGQWLRVKRCTVAAKTGTAEIGDDKARVISWFAGFRTGVEPEDARLVLVMLEVPSTDEFSKLKFDIARELLELPTK